MFDLEKKEKFIILFLTAALLTGLAVKSFQKSNQIVDARIRAFTYEGIQKKDKKININEADAETIARLDRIGPSLAKRIVEYRKEKGYFRSVEDLKKINGIGDKLFDHIKNEVSIE